MTTEHALATGSVVPLLAGLASPTSAQDRRDLAVDQHQCRAIMRDSGADPDVAIAFLQGFLNGTSGQVRFNLDDLHKRTDAFIERW